MHKSGNGKNGQVENIEIDLTFHQDCRERSHEIKAQYYRGSESKLGSRAEASKKGKRHMRSWSKEWSYIASPHPHERSNNNKVPIFLIKTQVIGGTWLSADPDGDKAI